MNTTTFKQAVSHRTYFNMVTSVLEDMYFTGIRATDAVDAGIKYVVTKEPGKFYLPMHILGYASTFEEARAIMNQEKNNILSDNGYRSTDVRYDNADWCKIKTIMRCTGEINTYDIFINDVPHILTQYEHDKFYCVDRMPKTIKCSS